MGHLRWIRVQPCLAGALAHAGAQRVQRERVVLGDDEVVVIPEL
jgi:hypothetical protein